SDRMWGVECRKVRAEPPHPLAGRAVGGRHAQCRRLFAGQKSKESPPREPTLSARSFGETGSSCVGEGIIAAEGALPKTTVLHGPLEVGEVQFRLASRHGLILPRSARLARRSAQLFLSELHEERVVSAAGPPRIEASIVSNGRLPALVAQQLP